MPPLLDVADILDDPDLFEFGLQCIRQMQTVGVNGLAVNTPQTFCFAGVVTNEGERLKRGPDAERVSGSILIITRFGLLDGNAANSADIVQRSSGLQYTVMRVESYSAYGRGFVQAECQLIPMTG